MKIFNLKTIQFKDEDWPYKVNLITFLEVAAGEKGMNFAEMRKSAKIIDQIEAVDDGEDVVLEDDLYSFMMERLETHLRLGRVVRPLITMVDDLKHAKSKSAQRMNEEASKEVGSDHQEIEDTE